MNVKPPNSRLAQAKAAQNAPAAKAAAATSGAATTPSAAHAGLPAEPRRRRDDPTPAAAAREVLDGVPPLMQFIRHVAQQRKAPGLSVQQFRALAFLRNRPGDSLSSMAEYLGLSLPTASRMVDALVLRGLIHRQTIPRNRRQVQLTLTAAGSKSLEAAIQTTLDELSQRLGALDDARRRRIIRAVRDLRRLFEPPLNRSTPSS